MACKTPNPALNEDNLAALLARDAVIHFDKATITTFGKAEDRRFVMEGPSGKHTLLVDATDLTRLNAHRTVFAMHSANRIAA